MEKTLVVLAAGMGSRFGGMKQTFPVGPNGEFIMDYSIYSAVKYGFTKIVFVIREEYLDLFKTTIGARLEGKVKVDYAFQKLEDIPEGFEVPEGRTKPWGTAHAIYVARDKIEGKFGVITSDDFYGDNAFKVLAEHLDNSDNYIIVGYPVAKTLSENGAVKRGVILTNENGSVKSIIESSCILAGDHVECTPLNESIPKFDVPLDTPVSMLINGFTQEILTTIGNDMLNEFTNNKENLLSYEMLLTDTMDEEIKSGKTIDVDSTTATWIGMTYKEDAVNVQDHIQNEINAGVYPQDLWK